jgi:acyl-CoA synthetase (AMP-forming)/AMP-acid ligase II/lysophospholipase L1-like esterase
MKIVCFGDSLTECGGDGGRFSDVLQDRFPGHEFVNMGVSGETIADGLRRLPGVLTTRPDIVLVELGANDWHRAERSPAAWAGDLDTIISGVRDAGAQAAILGVFGDCLDDNGERIPKTEGCDGRGVEFHKLEQKIASQYGCPYVPNIQDRIMGNRCCWDLTNHPNEFGNRFVADTIQPVLESMLQEDVLPLRLPLAGTRDMWDEAVQLAPDQVAVVDGDRRLTYAEADAKLKGIAAGLSRAGVENPKVAASLPNCLEYYLLYWGVVHVRGTIVPLNTWLKSNELAGIMKNVEPDILVVRSDKDEVLKVAAEPGPRMIVALDPGEGELTGWDELLYPKDVAMMGGATPARHRACSGAGASLPADAEAGVPPVEAEDAPSLGDIPAIIMHTSGTTGIPKGAVMRHSDLMFNVVAAINAHGFCNADVHLLTSPMFHCGPFYTSLPTAAYTKTPVILASPTRPDELMAVIERERVTTFMSAPAVFQQLLKVPDLDNYDSASLRLLAYAGSPMPEAVIEELRKSFPGVALHNFFGLTETISMTHVLKDDEAETRPDSIGRLLPFVSAMVVDDKLDELPPGQTGELLFARENVVSSYYNQPGRIEESVVEINGDDWFRTGDFATVDKDGCFRIKGRKKDMIIVGGENVYADEVEAFLATHGKVREAAVKGESATGARSFLGEQVVAFVVPADESVTERELRQYCFEGLPSYKVPGKVVFMESLPRNPSGKIMKGDL